MIYLFLGYTSAKVQNKLRIYTYLYKKVLKTHKYLQLCSLRMQKSHKNEIKLFNYSISRRSTGQNLIL